MNRIRNNCKIAIAVAGLFAFALPAQATPKGGDLDPTFNPSSVVSGPIYSIAVQPDGKVLIGGYFNRYYGAPRNGIARLDPYGSLDSSFQDGTDTLDNNPSYYVRSIAVQSDGKVVIGGFVPGGSNWTRIGVARLNTDGSLDTGFQSATTGAEVQYCPYFNCDYYPGDVLSAAVQSDGKVLVGGIFSRYNGYTRNGIARLNTDGSMDTGFQNPFLLLGTYIYSIAIQADGKIIVGGNNGITRLNVTGSRDSNFVATANSLVHSVALQTDGKVLIGGEFTSVNGTNRNRIARLNTNGNLDTSFQNGLSGANGTVSSIAVQSNGKILIGGDFTSINGASRIRLARLNADGSLDSTFQNGMTGTDNRVESIALQSDSKVIIGGDFLTVNGATLPYLARLYGITPLLLSNVGILSNQFGFDVIGDSNQVVVVEASTNLASWTALSTNTLGAAPLHFSDPGWTSFPKRFYRARVAP